ncbi:hypothetical protein OH77DRAFT_278177 [Trametes cingulata]|nr:hypothetical protein OH77DRAFT_278177 [Trametes cingulata]
MRGSICRSTAPQCGTASDHPWTVGQRTVQTTRTRRGRQTFGNASLFTGRLPSRGCAQSHVLLSERGISTSFKGGQAAPDNLYGTDTLCSPLDNEMLKLTAEHWKRHWMPTAMDAFLTAFTPSLPPGGHLLDHTFSQYGSCGLPRPSFLGVSPDDNQA